MSDQIIPLLDQINEKKYAYASCYKRGDFLSKKDACYSWRIAAWPRYGETNPRNTYMYDELEALNVKVIDLKNKPWEWVSADYIHVHWPENAFTGVFKIVAFFIFMACLKVTRKKIIWTVHNDPKIDIKKSYFLFTFQLFIKNVDLFLLPSSLSLRILKNYRSIDSLKWGLLPLGLYPKLEGISKRTTDRHLIIGRLTNKKNIIETVTSLCKKWPDQNFLVAGLPENDDMERALKALSTKFGNLQLELDFLSDRRIADLVSNARSVIIDYPKGNINSGIATLAGTYATPIFVKNKSMRKDLSRLYKIKAGSMSEFPNYMTYDTNNLDMQVVAKRYLLLLERKFGY